MRACSHCSGRVYGAASVRRAQSELLVQTLAHRRRRRNWGSLAKWTLTGDAAVAEAAAAATAAAAAAPEPLEMNMDMVSAAHNATRPATLTAQVARHPCKHTGCHMQQLQLLQRGAAYLTNTPSQDQPDYNPMPEPEDENMALRGGEELAAVRAAAAALPVVAAAAASDGETLRSAPMARVATCRPCRARSPSCPTTRGASTYVLIVKRVMGGCSASVVVAKPTCSHPLLLLLLLLLLPLWRRHCYN